MTEIPIQSIQSRQRETVNRDIGKEKCFRLDGQPRALFYPTYGEMYRIVAASLWPYAEITDGILAMLGNNLLQPTSFDLRKSDRANVFDKKFMEFFWQQGNQDTMSEPLIYPGKSFHFAFNNTVYWNCMAVFDREPKRQDRLYTVIYRDLIKLGFRAYWAPIFNHPLHVRVIHQSQIDDLQLRDCLFSAKVKLSRLMQEGKIES